MHTELIEISDKKHRGSFLSSFRVITNIIGILSPVIAGYLIARYGYYSTFIIGVLISLFAILPIMKLKEKKKHFD
jgi:MFS family permease